MNWTESLGFASFVTAGAVFGFLAADSRSNWLDHLFGVALMIAGLTVLAILAVIVCAAGLFGLAVHLWKSRRPEPSFAVIGITRDRRSSRQHGAAIALKQAEADAAIERLFDQRVAQRVAANAIERARKASTVVRAAPRFAARR